MQSWVESRKNLCSNFELNSPTAGVIYFQFITESPR